MRSLILQVHLCLGLVAALFLLLLSVGLAEQIIFDGGNATSPLGNTEFFGMRFTAGVSY